MFYEIVIAPSYTEAGLTKLKGKSKTLRILEAKERAPSGRSLRQIGGTSLCCAFEIIIMQAARQSTAVCHGFQNFG